MKIASQNPIITLFYLMFFSSFPVFAEEDRLTEGLQHPGYVEKPVWFKNSFLDIREDREEATKNNKRLMLYFYQDGCPYCERLIKDNFTRKDLVAKTRKYFDVVAINMWGDREVTDFSGKETTEKAFARALRVQYTPTLLMLDEKGDVVLRINGYYHPRKFAIALDYVGNKKESVLSFREYRKQVAQARNSWKVNHQQDNFEGDNFHAILKNGKPLLLIFEEKGCDVCAELHQDILKRPLSVALLDKLSVRTVNMDAKKIIITPDNKKMFLNDWAKQLDIKYSPSMVFFDPSGKEVIRTEAYLKAFHVQSVMDYVISGAYRTEPELQRFIEYRADAMREKGIEVDLMK